MNNKVILGTHMRGGKATSTAKQALSLKAEFDVMNQIAASAGLADYGILILKQPRKMYTIGDRQQDKREWQNAAKALGGRLNLIYDLDYIPQEPKTLAWNKLHRYAFEELQAETFMYVDLMLPKWEKTLRNAAIKKLGELAEQSQKADYVIGDYTPVPYKDPKDPTRQEAARMKIIIEEGVKQMLSSRFPTILSRWPLFKDLKRPRSEFHALSKRLYNDLKTLAPIPYDYGLQMLIVARVKDRIIRREDIGNVPETGTYSPHKMIEQLRRVDFQLAQIQDWYAK